MHENINTKFIIIYFIFAYLSGSFPAAYVIGRLKGIDIRKHGSGNVGATNTMRVLGKSWGSIVFIIDILKGFLPVFILSYIFKNSEVSYFFLLSIGFMAVLGHIYPVWLKFSGGKGVATACGVLLAIIPFIVLISMGIFIVIVSLFKYVSLASIISALSLPVLFYIFEDVNNDIRFFIFLIVVSIFVVYKHKSNIIRIIHGNENKI
ncbi:MAG: glycerol-3-phosphate 1-O-acyltransferase PlsY [Spirochaetia bacterium]|nr:glycerol-3-phosphate 1-O-acyltransferase PlsY [Spirochaetia bacterium]